MLGISAAVIKGHLTSVMEIEKSLAWRLWFRQNRVEFGVEMEAQKRKAEVNILQRTTNRTARIEELPKLRHAVRDTF